MQMKLGYTLSKCLLWTLQVHRGRRTILSLSTFLHSRLECHAQLTRRGRGLLQGDMSAQKALQGSHTDKEVAGRSDIIPDENFLQEANRKKWVDSQTCEEWVELCPVGLVEGSVHGRRDVNHLARLVDLGAHQSGPQHWKIWFYSDFKDKILQKVGEKT